MAKKPGLSLLDIADISATVPCGDSFFTVYGISSETCVTLANRFPTLLKLIAGGKFGPTDLAAVGPAAIAAILAAGCREEGEEFENAARKLPIELQFDLLKEIGGLTFKSGFGPFVKKFLDALNSAASFGLSGKATATNLHPRSSNSSLPVTEPMKSGD